VNEAQHGIAGGTGLFGDFTRGVAFDSIEVEGFALLGTEAREQHIEIIATWRRFDRDGFRIVFKRCEGHNLSAPALIIKEMPDSGVEDGPMFHVPIAVRELEPGLLHQVLGIIMMMRESEGVAVAGLHQVVRIILSARHRFHSCSIREDDSQFGLIAPEGNGPLSGALDSSVRHRDLGDAARFDEDASRRRRATNQFHLVSTRVEGEQSAVIPGAHLGAVFPVNAIVWVLPDVILPGRLPTLAVRREDPELTAVFDCNFRSDAGSSNKPSQRFLVHIDPGEYVTLPT